MTELGVNLIPSPTGVNNVLDRTTTEQFAAPGFTDLKWSKESSEFGGNVTSAEGKFTFSDFLNLFLFSAKYDIGAMVKALSTRGLFQSLAEPNLVAESGKEASFLAGGEYPIPVAQGGSGSVAITVQYKEYGIRLNFLPIVNGNRVHLKVRPEVSTLAFANAIVLNGFRIPALSSRRTETEIELNNGQTFAVAGLMNNSVNTTMQKIPGIGDIPILGLLFKSKAAQKNQTELVVMITPEILPNNSFGVTNSLPHAVEPYMPPVQPKKGVEQPAPAFKPTQGASIETPAVPVATAVPTTTNGSARDAAAAMSALTPNTRAVVNGDAAKPAAQPLPAAPRPLTESEKKAQSKALKLELQQQEAAAHAKAIDDARAAKEAQARAAKQGEEERRRFEAEKKQAEADKQLQEKAAREQAKRTAEEQKRQAELAKKQQTATVQKAQ